VHAALEPDRLLTHLHEIRREIRILASCTPEFATI